MKNVDFMNLEMFSRHFYNFLGRKTKTKSIFNVDENFQKFKLSIEFRNVRLEDSEQDGLS